MKRILTILIVVVMCMTCPADYVNAPNGLNVREKPTIDSAVIKVLPFGTEVPGGDGDWIPYNGGYIAAEWLCKDQPMELLGTWRVTAYAWTGCACACGEYPETGRTIAHNTLPFGTKVYIDGVGVREVMDRGQEWLGSEWCDLYLGDTQTCVQWGDQYREVYLINGTN